VLRLCYRISQNPRLCETVRNKFFLLWGVVTPLLNPKLEGHPPLAVSDCYPPYLQAVSSIRNLRTRHAVVTRDPLKTARGIKPAKIKIKLSGIAGCSHIFTYFKKCIPYRAKKWLWAPMNAVSTSGSHLQCFSEFCSCPHFSPLPKHDRLGSHQNDYQSSTPSLFSLTPISLTVTRQPPNRSPYQNKFHDVLSETHKIWTFSSNFRTRILWKQKNPIPWDFYAGAKQHTHLSFRMNAGWLNRKLKY
jgi:hypothetical protein